MPYLCGLWAAWYQIWPQRGLKAREYCKCFWVQCAAKCQLCESKWVQKRAKGVEIAQNGSKQAQMAQNRPKMGVTGHFGAILSHLNPILGHFRPILSHFEDFVSVWERPWASGSVQSLRRGQKGGQDGSMGLTKNRKASDAVVHMVPAMGQNGSK